MLSRPERAGWRAPTIDATVAFVLPTPALLPPWRIRRLPSIAEVERRIDVSNCEVSDNFDVISVSFGALSPRSLATAASWPLVSDREPSMLRPWPLTDARLSRMAFACDGTDFRDLSMLVRFLFTV